MLRIIFILGYLTIEQSNGYILGLEIIEEIRCWNLRKWG